VKKYPNHPSMPYELPIPFTPCGPPSDDYRTNYDRIFHRHDWIQRADGSGWDCSCGAVRDAAEVVQ
jgi:hypothetical protein